ncbi:hypothetical protein ISN45_Aa04g031500, partial [Arabidopsis thaliana x Arabidopsis arenosa]
RLSSPPTLVVEGVNSSPNWRIVAYEIGDKFNRSSSFDSKSVTIVILSRIMYLVAPSTRSSHSRPRLSIRLTSRTRKMAKAYNGQDVNGTA